MRFLITADSTCDLSKEQIKEHNIGILPLHIELGGKEHLDGIDIVPDDIYAYVEGGGDLAATAAVNPDEYVNYFKTHVKDVDYILHINISSDFSSCYQNACIAAEAFDNVYVVDSRNLSTGHGLVVMEACRMAEEGLDPEEIVEQLNELTGRVEASFILEHLSYLRKGGRCSSIAALGANMLRLRPCIEVRDGKMGVGKKYRGNFENCLRAYIQDQIKDRKDLDLTRIFITHSRLPEQTIQVAIDTVKELQPFSEVCETLASCTVSTHCGPGTIGVLFIRKK
ncbi:MAG: DegV family protein [Lachnospiraceae bacterium]|nr:DegV family protein [Lachnospiraceae bacterium]